MAVELASVRSRASTAMSGFSAGQKAVTAVAAVALLVGAMAFVKWSSRPQFVPLFTNLEASDAAAITEKLGASKTPYRLGDSGRTVMVPRSDVYELRVQMTSQGLPAGGSKGFSILDKQGITTSEFRQRVDYQRALEGELSRTIESMDGVAGATVHLVIPSDDVFAKDSRKPTASVLVKPAGQGTLSGSHVQAVVHLVSSSIEGLEPADVTVADTRGRVLSTAGDAAGAAAGDAQAGQARTFEDALSRSVQEMLDQVVGPGRAVVRVRADLDFDSRATTSEVFNGGQAPVASESTTKESFSGSGGAAGGVLGPDATPAAPAGGNNNYAKEDARREYAVGKVTEQVKAAPGRVKRLSVAVLLDSNGPPADAATVERVVSAATGLDPNRGDTIAVDRVAFDRSAAKAAEKELAAAAQARQRQSQLSLVRSGAVGLVVLATLLALFRTARRSERREALPLPPSPLPAGAPAGAHPAALAPPPAVAPLALDSGIGDMIERQPDEVAHLLRGWLAERA